MTASPFPLPSGPSWADGEWPLSRIADKEQRFARAQAYDDAIDELGGDLKKWLLDAEFHAEVEMLVRSRHGAAAMTAERIAAIETRLAAATPGEWYDEHGAGFIRTKEVDNIAFVYGTLTDRKPNLTFIANAPADIAYLLAELAKYGELLRRLRQWDHMQSQQGDFPYWRREITVALAEAAAPTLAAMRAEEQ